jgi:hypothetical protein
VAFQVFAPVQRRGLQITKVEGSEGEAFQVLRRIVDKDSVAQEIAEPEMEALIRLGILVPPHEVPHPVVMECWLPDEDAPAQGPVPEGLSWTPGIRAFAPTQPPPRWPLAIPEGSRLLLIPDPRTGVSTPGLVEENVRWFQRWSANEAPQGASCPGWQALLEAGILSSRPLAAPTFGADQARFFREEGYVVLRGLLSPALLSRLQPYYRALVEQGYLPRGDGQSDRYAAHNEKWARWLHLELEAALQVVAPGHKASYSYLGSYVAGAVLARHTDREQCGLTASVCIDAWGTEPPYIWPLGLEDRRQQDVKAELLPGDALLFRGTELPHYRDRLPEGCSSTNVFFHFVDEQFQGSLD